MLFSFPLMSAMQEICGRLGRLTGSGIADNLRRHYPKPLLYGLVLLLCVANIFNLGADITAMGAAAQLVFGGNVTAFAVGFGVLSLVLQICIPYTKYVNYLKWLTTVLFAYVATAFVVHVPWLTALRYTILPSFQWKAEYWMALVAILGTTISPYLFFWQASEEAEDVCLEEHERPLKEKPRDAAEQFHRIAIDTRVGMAFSESDRLLRYPHYGSDLACGGGQRRHSDFGRCGSGFATPGGKCCVRSVRTRNSRHGTSGGAGPGWICGLRCG